jgi:hypothetical protein
VVVIVIGRFVVCIAVVCFIGWYGMVVDKWPPVRGWRRYRRIAMHIIVIFAVMAFGGYLIDNGHGDLVD